MVAVYGSSLRAGKSVPSSGCGACHSPRYVAEQLAAALAQHGGNQSRAAQSLGLTLRQFAYRLKKAGLR